MWLAHASISRWERERERVSSTRAFWPAYLLCHYEVERDDGGDKTYFKTHVAQLTATTVFTVHMSSIESL